MQYKFPEIKFSRTNTFIQQLEHLLSECKELQNELPFVYTDREISCMKPRIMSEVLDIMQSAESLCRVYEREGGDLDAVEMVHCEKDRRRGYHVKGDFKMAKVIYVGDGGEQKEFTKFILIGEVKDGEIVTATACNDPLLAYASKIIDTYNRRRFWDITTPLDGVPRE